MKKKINIINNFKNIIIKDNTLVLCDIDETLVRIKNIDKKWWIKTKNFFSGFMEKEKEIEFASFSYWLKYVSSHKAEFTDKEGFLYLLNQIKETNNSKIIFITSRPKNCIPITKKHFYDLNLDYNLYEIHHLNFKPKGEFVYNNIDISNFENILFFDDHESNLENVFKYFGNLITLYKFVI